MTDYARRVIEKYGADWLACLLQEENRPRRLEYHYEAGSGEHLMEWEVEPQEKRDREFLWRYFLTTPSLWTPPSARCREKQEDGTEEQGLLDF